MIALKIIIILLAMLALIIQIHENMED